MSHDRPQTEEELNSKLFGNFLRVRPMGDPSAKFLNQEADVRYIWGHAIQLTYSVAQTSRWKELFSALSSDSCSPEQVQTMTLEALHRVRDFCERSCEPDTGDMDIVDTLREVGWEQVDERGRAGALAMLSLFVLSRVWLINRQHVKLGEPKNVAFEPIAIAVSQAARVYDQNLDPYDDAAEAISHAINYAKCAGLSRERIQQLCSEAIQDKTQDLEVGPAGPKGA